VGRHQGVVFLAHDQAAGLHAQQRDGKAHIASALGSPQQHRITGQAAAVLQHLQATRTIDPHGAVGIFGHLLDQLR